MKMVNIYAATAFLVMFIATSLKATIIYTDLVGGQTLSSGTTIEINFDQTGASEYTFEDISFGGATEPSVFFKNDAVLLTVSVNEWDVLKGVPKDTDIDDQVGFIDQLFDAYVDPFWGNTKFPSLNDTYIGARFMLNSEIHYGWIRVNWDGLGVFVVKDYAYEDVPDAGIKAGDKGVLTRVSVPVDKEELVFYPNPVKEEMHINWKDQQGELAVKVVDNMGIVVASYLVQTSDVIDTRKWRAGVYTITIDDGTRVVIDHVVVVE